jgi:hypothetical protein
MQRGRSAADGGEDEGANEHSVGSTTPLDGLEEDWLASLHARFESLRGDPSNPPAVSIVVPVNAREDLATVIGVVEDAARYGGGHTLEVVLVVNNYPPDEPPAEIDVYTAMGLRTVAVPDVYTPGEAVCFSARLPGLRAAESDHVVFWDADCKVPDPTALLDWYVARLSAGASSAYTRVDYHELRDLWSVRVRIIAHHGARWIKRVVLRIPTLRGSNYAVRRDTMLRLHDAGLLSDDLNVGPAMRAEGGACVYSGDRRLAVFTSGRRFMGGWRKLAHYLRYRFVYNVRMLPVGRAARARKRYHATNARKARA